MTSTVPDSLRWSWLFLPCIPLRWRLLLPTLIIWRSDLPFVFLPKFSYDLLRTGVILSDRGGLVKFICVLLASSLNFCICSVYSAISNLSLIWCLICLCTGYTSDEPTPIILTTFLVPRFCSDVPWWSFSRNSIILWFRLSNEPNFWSGDNLRICSLSKLLSRFCCPVYGRTRLRVFWMAWIFYVISGEFSAMTFGS